ncbi:MAG: hypothetical protein A4E49_02503 [Methanosaeta sp. PtaU1.Bin112]|nr:MAG: hypothetical protein A4E49_02503 [Methanosaeta sp. PtaU1.Bin112]
MAELSLDSRRLSLLAVSSKLNITVHNQGDNCIVARSGAKLIKEPNQTSMSSQEEDVCLKFIYNSDADIKYAVGCWLNSLPGEQDQYTSKGDECRLFNSLLKDFKDLQAIKQTLLQAEALRLKKKLGADHMRVLQMETRLKQNLSIVEDLEVKAELAKIHVPEIPEGGTLLHGRVTGKSYRGIKGLRVFIESGKGDEFRSLAGETDASGYYAIQIDSGTIDKLGRLRKIETYLTVSSKKGKIIHKGHEPLILKSDTSLIANVVLDLSILGTMR